MNFDGTEYLISVSGAKLYAKPVSEVRFQVMKKMALMEISKSSFYRRKLYPLFRLHVRMLVLATTRQVTLAMLMVVSTGSGLSGKIGLLDLALVAWCTMATLSWTKTVN